MTTITASPAQGKPQALALTKGKALLIDGREIATSALLKAEHCRAKVAKRTKFYDTGRLSCRGFLVDVTTSGGGTFYFKYTNRKTGKREQVQIGVYHPEEMTVVMARAQAFILKGRADNGAELPGEVRRAKGSSKKQGRTVSQVIDEYMAWMKEPVEKDDGEMRARKKSWATTEQYLVGYAEPRLGNMVISEVTSDDVAQLQNGLADGSLCK